MYMSEVDSPTCRSSVGAWASCGRSLRTWFTLEVIWVSASYGL